MVYWYTKHPEPVVYYSGEKKNSILHSHTSSSLYSHTRHITYSIDFDNVMAAAV